MKKFRLFLLTCLLMLSITGLVSAANIPAAVDPDDGGPEVWTIQVYNDDDSSGDFDVGDIVIWDIDASTGDNDNWVTTTATADYTGAIAGIVYPKAIAYHETGSVAIWGSVQADILNGHGQTLYGYICTSATAGSGRDCASATNSTEYGQIVQVGSSTSAQILVNTLSP